MAIKITATVFLLAGLVQGCALPQLNDRTQSTALTPQLAAETRLGVELAGRLAQNPGKAGIYPIHDPKQAFASRVALVRAAERTIDIQSYLWHNDTTGTLMLNELLAAAERGVRVRLLLDDNGITGLDNQLNRLDRHSNIEVRLFNPFVIRNPKWLGYITDFSRANRRMHNKSFTVDNMATISGGRNIGDEYFGATDAGLFTDLDMLCVGTVVDAVSRDFDAYWQSDSAYPASKILPSGCNLISETAIILPLVQTLKVQIPSTPKEGSKSPSGISLAIRKLPRCAPESKILSSGWIRIIF